MKTINTTIEAQDAVLALRSYFTETTNSNDDLEFIGWVTQTLKVARVQEEILAEAERQAPVAVTSSKHLVLDENCNLVEVEEFPEEESDEKTINWEEKRRIKNEKKAEAQRNMPFNPNIKFMQHAVTDGVNKIKIWYGTYDDGSVSINGSSYSDDLSKLFPGIVKNDSDSQSDYFEKDSVRLFSTSPYYKLALGRVKVNEAKRIMKNISKNPNLIGKENLGYGHDEINEMKQIMKNEKNYLAGKF